MKRSKQYLGNCVSQWVSYTRLIKQKVTMWVGGAGICITERCLCVTRHRKENLELRKQHFVHGLQSAHWCTQIRRQEAYGLPCSSGTLVGRTDPLPVENSVLCRQYASNKSWCSFAFNMSYLEGILEAKWRADRPSWREEYWLSHIMIDRNRPA